MSASEIQSILAAIQLNDYQSVAIATAIGYDFILTFANEIEYVWKRPWSRVSMLFIIVRYVGCLTAMLDGFIGSIFMPGPIMMCMVTYLIQSWAFVVFLGASDFLMILRVYAMYNLSKKILSILLVIYIPTMALTIVPLVYKMTRKLYLSVYLVEVVDVTLCIVPDTTIPIPSRYLLGSRFILGALLCIFAVAKFVRGSLETHREIKQWRSNRYMELLVRESILYFIINLLSNALISTVTSGMQSVVSIITIAILPYVIAPRFVISVREFHSRAVEHIDTGFGVVSHVDAIVFASAGDMPVGDAEAAGSEGGSGGAQVWSDVRDAGVGGEAAEGASG